MSLTDNILKEYLHMTHLASKQFRGHYGKMNLTFPQALVLSILDSDGIMPISSLAETTGSANSTISGVVDRLERMGLVKRIRSEKDRRVIYVDVTDEYRRIREERATGVSDYFHNLMKTVSEEEQQEIYNGLKKLSAVLDEED